MMCVVMFCEERGKGNNGSKVRRCKGNGDAVVLVAGNVVMVE